MLRADAPRALVIVALLTGCWTAVDTGYVLPDNALLPNLVISALAIALQYWVTRGVLRDWGLGPLRFRLLAYLLLGLVASLGISLGLLLLLVPGIILAVRWSLAGPVLVGSDKGVVESLQISWLETEGHFWPILAASLVLYGPPLVFRIVEVVMGLNVAEPLVLATAIGLVEIVLLVASWYLTLAMFTLILEPDPLQEVFE